MGNREGIIVTNPPGGYSSIGWGKFLELLPPSDDVIHFGGHEMVHFTFLVDEEEVTVALALSVAMKLLADWFLSCHPVPGLEESNQ